MNEPKRRGRPPKAKNAEDLAPVVEAVSAAMPEGAQKHIAAQAYAMRVWAGQSISAERSWRIQRVKEALEGQGLPFEGVELP